MYKVKFYLLHGWLKIRNDGENKYRLKQLSIPVKELSKNVVYDFRTINFKIENIEVVYDYSESEGNSND
jgi:hypothetical protein